MLFSSIISNEFECFVRIYLLLFFLVLPPLHHKNLHLQITKVSTPGAPNILLHPPMVLPRRAAKPTRSADGAMGELD